MARGSVIDISQVQIETKKTMKKQVLDIVILINQLYLYSVFIPTHETNVRMYKAKSIS